jgi:lysophospholipase L1-like esterase
MNIKHLGILCSIALLIFCASGVLAATGTVKIMPLGDSITKGSVTTTEEAKHPTYRYWLWNDLRKNGYDVDFVGSRNLPNFPNVSFDQDNEGHGGYSSDEILHGVPDDRWEPGYLAEWIQGYDFDMVLLLIGTNDVLREIPLEETAINIEKIVTVLRQKNPKVTIFMATLPPASHYRQSLIDLNQEIVRIADRTTTSESRVIVVDQYYGYDGVGDNQPPGYVHPDESGEKKLAKNWYDAITPYLSGAAPTPTPTPLPTPAPTPIPTPVPTEVPATVAPPVVTTTIATPTAIGAVSAEPTSRFGVRRYTIGGMAGSSRGGFSSASGTRYYTSGNGSSRLSPGNPANGTKPPSKLFVRWYPAQRWASGLR